MAVSTLGSVSNLPDIPDSPRSRTTDNTLSRDGGTLPTEYGSLIGCVRAPL